MAREPRIKVPGHAAAYHIVTRTRGKDHLIDTRLKERFIDLLSKLKKLYYVEYAAYTVLDNHYHLLVNFKDPQDINPKEAVKRWNEYHDKTPFTRRADIPAHVEYVVEQLTDISSFMKRLNYHMTLGYNLPRQKQGTLWERRYRSSIVERGPAMVMTAAYIELNAFRASLTNKPEDYKYSSLHELKTKTNKIKSIDHTVKLINRELLDEGLYTRDSSIEELYKTYKAYIYQTGTSPHKNKPNGIVISQAMQEQLKNYGLEKVEQGSLSSRIRELINGKVTAGMAYARDFYWAHIDPGFVGAQSHRHESGWVQHLRGGIWNVCSAVARGEP